MKFTLALVPCALVLFCIAGCGDAPMEGAAPAAAPAPMTAASDMIGKNKAVCAKLITAINHHDLKMADDLFDAKFKDNSPAPGFKPDKDGMMKTLADFFTGFPDSNCTCDLIIGEGDTVAVKLTTTGTNTGPSMGMPASNKPVTFDEIHIVKIKNGKIVEHWGLLDIMSMMTQMGQMKAEAK